MKPYRLVHHPPTCCTPVSASVFWVLELTSVTSFFIFSKKVSVSKVLIYLSSSIFLLMLGRVKNRFGGHFGQVLERWSPLGFSTFTGISQTLSFKVLLWQYHCSICGWSGPWFFHITEKGHFDHMWGSFFLLSWWLAKCILAAPIAWDSKGWWWQQCSPKSPSRTVTKVRN